MKGVNKAILVGTVGKDPEHRVMSNGKGFCNFSIATSERWKDKNGEFQEKTEWHRITCFDKLADICGQYVKKASKLYVEGSIYTRKWTDDAGVDRYSTEIKAMSIQIISDKKDQGDDEPKASEPSSGKNSYAEATGGKAKKHDIYQQDDDDGIPF